MKKKILFADDDQDFLTGLKDFFSMKGFEVDTAENGVVALDKVLAGQFDIAVFDINMPFMKGHETVKIVKASFPDLPVLAFTGQSIEETELLKQQNVFDQVVLKPLPMPEFEKILFKHLKIDSLPPQDSQTPAQEPTPTPSNPPSLDNPVALQDESTVPSPLPEKSGPESANQTVSSSSNLDAMESPEKKIAKLKNLVAQMAVERKNHLKTIGDLQKEILRLRKENIELQPKTKDGTPPSGIPSFEIE